MFSTLYCSYFSFEMHFKRSSAICFNLDQSKILLSDNGIMNNALAKRGLTLIDFYCLALSQQALIFMCLQDRSYENSVGKGEIACKKQFLLFSTVVSTLLKSFLQLSSNLKLSSANSFSLEESKICHLGIGLNAIGWGFVNRSLW